MSKLDLSCFANVDLDIHSKSDLQPLVNALGDSVIDLFVGRIRRTYEAHLELAAGKNNQTPTSIILGFCSIIRALPRSKRRIWDTAKSRSFDIGIYAPVRNHYWSAVSAEAVRAAAELNAQFAVTVYGSMKPAKPKSSRKTNPSP